MSSSFLLSSHLSSILFFFFFFFNDPATTEIYTLSLHDALPISLEVRMTVHSREQDVQQAQIIQQMDDLRLLHIDRKSTRLNSSHEWISYAVFCLKKKKKKKKKKMNTTHKIERQHSCVNDR